MTRCNVISQLRETNVCSDAHIYARLRASLSLAVCPLCIDAYAQTGEKQMTCIWVTHRLEELQYADRATLLVDGKVAASGDAASVKKAMTSR